MLTTLFVLFVIAGRILMQYILTGNHGLRPPGKDATIITRFTSVLFSLSFLTIYLLSALDYFGYSLFAFESDIDLTALGILLALAALIFAVLSQYQMGRDWRIGVDTSERTDLITHGIYSYMRNPIYSGIFLFCVAITLIIPSTVILIALIGVGVSIVLQVQCIEEPYLLQLHGERFSQYCESSGRYLPRF